MGLFGSPSEISLQRYRDNLRVVVPIEPLCFHSIQLFLFRSNTDQYDFKTLVVQLPTSTLETCVIDRNDAIGMTSKSTQIDSGLPPSRTSSVGTILEPINYQNTHDVAVDSHRVLVASAACVKLHAADCVINLITASGTTNRSANTTLPNAIIKKYTFLPIQQHSLSTLFSQQATSKPRVKIKVAPVARPTPPPSQPGETLQDRIRQILTPPIHEILSDPQLSLPEVPFPYQTQGIKWLYDRTTGLLADEMGLGKTMQAIIAARLLWRDGFVKQILIVCPKSLIPNWKKELQTWWPGIESYMRVAENDRRMFFRLPASDVTVKIINYEALSRDLDFLKVNRTYHDLVIIDEAQRIKNTTSKTAQAVKLLKSDRRWALTGTPLENSINDLVSIFEFVAPGLIEGDVNETCIRDYVKPFMLRRRQEDVLPDLPPIIEQDIEIELQDCQREAYELAEREGVVSLNEKGDTITISHVFALINKLRQICNFDPTSKQSAKTDLILEELDEIIQSNRKTLIFGHFVKEPFGLKMLAKRLAESTCLKNRGRPLELHGEIPQHQRGTIISQFENDPISQLLLLNYGVGGVGLNLQAANYVFLFDRWWNPAVEDQAIKRAHRLGQKRTVFVKRLYCKNTIEERILTKLAEKRRIFSNVIDDENPSAESFGLSEDEIYSLFNLKVRPRRTGQKPSPAKIILENIGDKEFEYLVASVYEKEGYKVQVTGRSHDGGIDIVAERVNAEGKDRIIVQCKHTKQNVGRPVLQQLWGVVHNDQSVTRCDVVTSAQFTVQALEFALGKRISLIDGQKLEEWAQKLGVAVFENSLVPTNDVGADSSKPVPKATSRVGTQQHRRLDKWSGSLTLGEVRDQMKKSGEFRHGWDRFLEYLELPLGIGLTQNTKVADARRLTRS